MFKRFLKRARDRSRYLSGPFAAERERYMTHLCSEGRTEGVLAEINGLLLTIAERIDVLTGSSITREQVRTAADEWIKQRAASYKTAQRPKHAGRRFISVGCAWLRFLGCLSESRVEMPGSDVLSSFSAYLLARRVRLLTSHSSRPEGLPTAFFLLAGTTEAAGFRGQRQGHIGLFVI